MGIPGTLRSSNASAPAEAADGDLIEQVRHGERFAYGVLYERHAPAARRFARSLGMTEADADDVVAALLALDGRKAEPPENPMSADRVRWEHIQRIYELCGRNVSETARRLNMHRRTLQRILAKRAPK